MREILREWELNADLVTLSACETGLGKEVGGEGYLGLAHAFLQVGARSLLVGLWRADDAATALLMRRFYANWIGEDDERGMTKAEALGRAKRWLRDLTYEEVATEMEARGLQSATDTRGAEQMEDGSSSGSVFNPSDDRPYAHPFFWAPFILIGDTD